MRPVSSAFLNAIRGSHRLTVRGRVTETFQTGTQPVGTRILIQSGDVTSQAKVFGGSEVYGSIVSSTADVTTDGTRMWPVAADDLLAPYGNEVYLERGITFGNGTEEFVGLGYFRINTVEQPQGPDYPIRISASDRMAGIEDSRFTQPRQYLRNTATLGSIVNDLVLEIYPDAVIEWDDNTNEAVLGRDLIFEKDRFEALADLVTSVGKMALWDHRGTLVIQDIPDPTTPVFDVDSGPDGVLVQLNRDLSREGVFNGVVATGEAADNVDPPVHALAVDDGPDSPTLWGGKFGKVPRFYSSPFIVTTPQARSAAQAILRQSVGLPYNVDFQSVPNVALEPLDTVRVVYPQTSRSPSTREELHVLQSIRYPLSEAAPMMATTREQKLVTVGFE